MFAGDFMEDQPWFYSHSETLPTNPSSEFRHNKQLWTTFTHLVTATDCKPYYYHHGDGGQEANQEELSLRPGSNHDVIVHFVPLTLPIPTYAGLNRKGIRSYAQYVRTWVQHPDWTPGAMQQLIIPLPWSTQPSLHLCTRKFGVQPYHAMQS